MNISRRRFLQGATATTLLGPSLLDLALARRALAQTIGNRYLVVLFLDGGNDGLNTLTPMTDGGATLRQAYNVHRNTGNGGLNLAPEVLLPVGSDPNSGAALGLHPALQGIHDLHSEKNAVAFLQGCGYPEPSLSHEVSTGIWQSANPLGVGVGGGWVGRHLANSYGPTDVPAVAVNYTLPGDFRQYTTSVLALQELRYFGFYNDDYSYADQAAQSTAFEALYGTSANTNHSQSNFIQNTGAATLLSSEAYRQLDDLYATARGSWGDRYDVVGRMLADDLREIAKIIYGVEQGTPNVTARYFQCQTGGYDTHSSQGAESLEDRHGSLLAEVGDSLKVFYEDLEDMGVVDDVAVLVWSEFGRRVVQNSNGTDHGTQGLMLLVGGGIEGGIYGNHPNINESALNDDGNTPYSQANTDPFRSIDFRDVYGTVLKQWAGVPHADVLNLMPLDVGSPSSEYWTEENFDLDLFTT